MSIHQAILPLRRERELPFGWQHFQTMVLAAGSSMGWNLFRGSCTAKSCTEASYSVPQNSRTLHSRCDYDRFELGKGDRCFQPQLLDCVSVFEENPTRNGF